MYQDIVFTIDTYEDCTFGGICLVFLDYTDSGLLKPWREQVQTKGSNIFQDEFMGMIVRIWEMRFINAQQA